jgi:hypothetical protein
VDVDADLARVTLGAALQGALDGVGDLCRVVPGLLLPC